GTQFLIAPSRTFLLLSRKPPRDHTMFGFGHHGHHGQNPPAHAPAAAGGNQPTFKIFCKADEGYCLSVRDGNVVLAPSNPRDEHQHWFKDMRFSSQIKDEEGNPAFAIVNKATGLAVKHSLGSANAPRGGSSEPTVRIFCKADDGFSATVRNGAVVLAPTNPRDEYQHWFKDMRHSNRIKDEEGYPAFALVNKVTGEAIKHSQGEGHPVKLVPYNANYQDESVLWTESRDVGAGFRCIRMVNNIYLNFDALHGDKEHGGVRDGTSLVLWKWCEGDNQRWKILPW
uniref:PH domain-containing protein n=1 Tax=Aegilops tauschii subsp. strangulata TaxID=200361 RepID=A0A453I6Q0_AEGTS